MEVNDGLLGRYTALVMLRRIHGEALLEYAAKTPGNAGLVAAYAAKRTSIESVAEELGLTPAGVEELAQQIEMKGL